MTKIARYIDDPPQFLLWSIDEILLFALFFGLGIITHTLIPLLIIGTSLTYLLGKVKQNKSEGYFIHAAYWRNLGLPLTGCPAFESKLPFRKWMAEEAFQQEKQMKHLFHNFKPEPCGF